MVVSELKGTCYFVILSSVIFSSGIAIGAPEEFRLFKLNNRQHEKLTSISKKAGLEKWPKSNILRPAPKINKSLLLNPGLITRENISYSPDLFIEGTHGVLCEWHWDYFVKNPDPLPADLPAERKAHLLEKMEPEKRNDPNFVKEYFSRKLAIYRKSKEHLLVGSIFMKVCIAPDTQTANEYLIHDRSMTSMPTQTVEWFFSESNRLKHIGTIAFYEQWGGFSHVMFVRDNIAVTIDARGELAEEALLLAQKIDALIQKQPALSYNQLLARRPAITIAGDVDETKAIGDKTISYNITAPAEQETVDIKAYVDDQRAPVRDGKIHIINKKGKVKVKLVATTSELLTNSLETEVIIPE